MKNIMIYFFLITTFVFGSNYDDMFNELEGITSIIILDSESKEAIEGVLVQVNNSENFTDNQGTVEYKPTSEELEIESLVGLNIEISGYLSYDGNFKAGLEKRLVYLEKKVIAPIKEEKTEKVLNYRVRVLSLESGTLYLEDKKLKTIKEGIESSFRVKEGIRTFTLDTEKSVSRKEVNITTPEILVIFTKDDIIKLKELPKPIIKIDPQPEKISKKQIVENLEKEQVQIPEIITNEYLISQLIDPLVDGSAFNITSNVTYFEMEEDEDKGDFVIYKTPSGNSGNMENNLVKNARRILDKNELLDDYYYIITNLEVQMKKEYSTKVQLILDHIAAEKKDYIPTKSNWSTENDGMYIAISSSKRIDNDEILDKVYRISYKNTKKYSSFFEKLNEVIKKEKEYQIKLNDSNIPIVAFNLFTNSSRNYFHDNIKTNLGNKKLSSSYSFMGDYLDKLDYNLLGNVYLNDNNYYFLDDTTFKLSVDLLKENDGRKITKSSYEQVK